MQASRRSNAKGMKPADLLRAARDEMLAGRHAKAAELSRTVLQTNPNALLALRVLGWAELELAQPTVRSHFAACLQIDPEDALAEVGLAIADQVEGHITEARRHFARACELDPGNDQVHAELLRIGGEVPTGPLIEGVRSLRAGDLGAAAKHLRAASALQPPDPTARLLLASVIWQLGARQQIENICLDILATNPVCLKPLLYLLALAVEWKRSLQVRDYLARVAAIDPGAFVARNLLTETGMAERVLGMVSTPAAASLKRS